MRRKPSDGVESRQHDAEPARLHDSNDGTAQRRRRAGQGKDCDDAHPHGHPQDARGLKAAPAHSKRQLASHKSAA